MCTTFSMKHLFVYVTWVCLKMITNVSIVLSSLSNNAYPLEYELVTEGKTCNGNGYVWGGDEPSLAACALSCEGRGSVFTYGRQDGERCDASKCYCYCWIDSLNGICKEGQADHQLYNLYRITKGAYLRDEITFGTRLIC